jgi:hypothetical protein
MSPVIEPFTFVNVSVVEAHRAEACLGVREKFTDKPARQTFFYVIMKFAAEQKKGGEEGMISEN